MRKTIWIVLACVISLITGFVLGTLVDDSEPELTADELRTPLSEITSTGQIEQRFR